jgi:hypothetical protein
MFGDFCSHKSTVSGHGDGGLALESAFALPSAVVVYRQRRIHVSSLPEPQQQNPHLILSIELDTTPSEERSISECASLVPTPREH